MSKQPRLDAPETLSRVSRDYGRAIERFLGINTSSVNRLAVSKELPEMEKYL